MIPPRLPVLASDRLRNFQVSALGTNSIPDPGIECISGPRKALVRISQSSESDRLLNLVRHEGPAVLGQAA